MRQVESAPGRGATQTHQGASSREARPLASPAAAAAVQAAPRETPRRKLTVNDFPAILRRDAAFDF